MSNSKLPVSAPWYSEGLKFECTQCGNCCTGFPGYTWVSEDEMVRLAEHLNMPLKEFVHKYLRRVQLSKNGEYRWALLEMTENFDCIFLKDKKCSVYQERPKQCRTFPWWQKNLASPESWKEAAKWCEGIHDDAPVVCLEAIEQAR